MAASLVDDAQYTLPMTKKRTVDQHPFRTHTAWLALVALVRQDLGDRGQKNNSQTESITTII